MFHRLILPVLAGLLFLFAALHSLYLEIPEPNPPPPMPPPTSPFGNTVAGAGMVEPCNEASGTATISVGSQLAGVVDRVHVRIGQEVKAGDLLFELDRRQAQSAIPPLQAALAVATAQQAVAQDLADRNSRLWNLQPMAVTAQEYRQSVLTALASAHQIEQARASLKQVQITLDLLQVRAPVNGTILQVNVRPSEAVTTAPGTALILMGNLKPYHVRVNVDEEDIPRLELKAPARAKLRGDPLQREIPLTFVRLEPYVVPKVSLTGINTERVDTRVAQVIYALDPEHPLVQEKKVLVGQLVDVFIDTQPQGRPVPVGNTSP